MNHLLRTATAAFALTLSLAITGCQTTKEYQGIQDTRMAMTTSIKSEEQGDYYIGRRFYKVDYKFWGYVRKPGEPWSSAKLVMLNEQTKLAPDREQGHPGIDNNYEYKLLGEYSGQTVYEPASNGKYPEFVLRGYELRNDHPASIFRMAGATDPTRRVIPQPY